MRFPFKISCFAATILLSFIVDRGLADDYRIQTLERAHELFRAATNSMQYAEAAKQYEYLISEEKIRNGSLFYNLGNSWFMANEPGRAILNYLRAEQYEPHNPDIQHNLNTARKIRVDLIAQQPTHPLLGKLFGWHYGTTTALRWWLFAGCWMVLAGALYWIQRSSQKEARITALISGLLSLVLLGSLLIEYNLLKAKEPGVILAYEVLARKGDGNMYAPAFLDPLHAGTEFALLENRTDWWHIQLANGITCWIPSRAAELVALTGK